MPDKSSQYPHIRLRFVAEGRAVLYGGGKPSQRTVANRGNTVGHGQQLKSKVSTIVGDWQQELEDRAKEEDKPELPKAIPFLLEVDPGIFDADILKGFGIEVIAELEDGYILGASADLELSELQKKIDKCIRGERGGGKVPEVWDVLSGTRRPEYILSESLYEEWSRIRDSDIYMAHSRVKCNII